MKNVLILLATVAASLVARAELKPTEYADLVFTSISADGTWVISSDEYLYNFTIINLSTGERWDYGALAGSDETYCGGLGRCVSNTGVVVASAYETDKPYYWENGQWHALPLRDTDYGAFPNSITPDGSRIAGSVSHQAISVEDGAVMTVPVIWERNASGTYDMYQVLPYPTADFTGRTPQYILVDDISADGRTLGGDVADYSGMSDQPVVFTQGDDGEWSYTLVHPELLNPGNVEFPPYPGDAPDRPEAVDFMTPAPRAEYEAALEAFNSRIEPQPTDFMTLAEQTIYFKALAAWENDSYNNPYPYPENYMTADEWAAYQEAYTAYWAVAAPEPLDYLSDDEGMAYQEALEAYTHAYDAWSEAYAAFYEVFNQVLQRSDVPAFERNSTRISPNGRYLIMSAAQAYEDPTSWFGFSYKVTPYIFDLSDNTYTVMDKGQQDVYATQVNNDAMVLAASPSGDYTRNAYIARGADAPFVAVTDYIKGRDTALYDWIEANMTHTVIWSEIVFDEETGMYDEMWYEAEKMMMGTAVANDDMTIFASWLFNNWSESESYFYSYILPVNPAGTGITDVAAEPGAFDVNIDSRGVITATGDIESVEVYDLSGRRVATAAATVARGVYIIRATATDGRVLVKKVVSSK